MNGPAVFIQRTLQSFASLRHRVQWIKELRQVFRVESLLTRDLPHDLHQRKRSSAHRLFRLAQALHAFDVARIERGFVPDGVLLPPIAFVGTDRAHQGRIETVVQRGHNSNALKFRLSHGSSGCLDGNLPSVTSSYRFRTLSRTFTRSVAM